jgi:drug/metabolite transporter (DMT)-like permease
MAMAMAGLRWPQGNFAGIAAVSAAVLCYALTDALVKWLARSYPVFEITFFRNVLTFAAVALSIVECGGWRSLKSKRVGLHLLRAGLGSLALLLFNFSFAALPLANVTAVSFTAPLILVVLSALILREGVSAAQWVAIAMGFAGTLVIINPDATVFELGSVLPLTASLAMALYLLFLRVLAPTETKSSLMFYVPVVGTVFTGVTLPWNWVTPAAADLVLILIMGLLAGVALYFRNVAYTTAKPSILAPFEYTSLLWASLIGSLVFGDHVTPRLLIGALLLIGGNMYIVYEQHRAMRRFPTTS